MFEWNGFDYGFVYTYGNRKGPHKQSLIVKCFYYFHNSNIFYFLKVRIDMLR